MYLHRDSNKTRWTWLGGLVLLSCASFVVPACGNDEGKLDNGGGAGGEGGAASSGGNGSGGADASGGTGGLGGAGGEGGANQAPTCSAPDFSGTSLGIEGVYVDDFDGSHTISSTSWEMSGSVFHFSQTNASEGVAIALNDEGNDYFPCQWSRFVWFTADSSLYYCQSPYGAASEDAAASADLPDSEDLESGCDGFSWSVLSSAID